MFQTSIFVKHKLLIILFLLSILFSPCVGQNEIFPTGEADFLPSEQEAVNFITDLPVEDLPKSVDLSHRFPKAGHQGTKGSCWAWATTYAYRSFILTEMQPKITFTHANGETNYEQIFSPEYTYQVYKDKQSGCSGGHHSYEILDYILRDGSVWYSEFPYQLNTCDIKFNATLKAKAKSNSLQGYRVRMINDQYSMKRALSKGNPLILSIKIDYDLQRVGKNWRTDGALRPLWDRFGQKKGSHAMVITGYDDNFQAFKVLNSWGTAWGDEGYVWISYRLMDLLMNYSCFAEKIKADPEQPVSEDQNQSENEQLNLLGNRLSSWVKEGYYRAYNGLRISLVNFDPKEEFAIIHIKNEDGDLKNSFYLEKGQMVTFSIDRVVYQLTFDNVGNAGKNFLKKAMFFSVSEQ